MNSRLFLNATKSGPFFNDYVGEFLVSIYIINKTPIFEHYFPTQHAYIIECQR